MISGADLKAGIFPAYAGASPPRLSSPRPVGSSSRLRLAGRVPTRACSSRVHLAAPRPVHRAEDPGSDPRLHGSALGSPVSRAGSRASRRGPTAPSAVHRHLAAVIRLRLARAGDRNRPRSSRRTAGKSARGRAGDDRSNPATYQLTRAVAWRGRRPRASPRSFPRPGRKHGVQAYERRKPAVGAGDNVHVDDARDQIFPLGQAVLLEHLPFVAGRGRVDVPYVPPLAPVSATGPYRRSCTRNAASTRAAVSCSCSAKQGKSPVW